MTNKNKTPWWRRTRHPAVLWLIDVFRVGEVDHFRLVNQFRRQNSRATAKRHCHSRRPTGSKLLKKFNRERWMQTQKEKISQIWEGL